MLWVLHDSRTLLHETVELLGGKYISALESPDRIRALVKALDTSSDAFIELDAVDKSFEDPLLRHFLAESHDRGYLEHLRTVHGAWVSEALASQKDSILPECFPVQRMFTGSSLHPRLGVPPKDIFARTGYYAFDMSTGICENTWTAVIASANLAVHGVRMLSSKRETSNTVMALCRPPGHHCNAKMAGGYCYINNAVVAVHAIRHLFGPNRSSPSEKPKVAIFDVDFHHGNGTQDYFYCDPSVLYVSIHGLHEYPYYSGFEDEIGDGQGEGFNLNLPLPAGSSIKQYLSKLDIAIRRMDQYAPDVLVVSLGFDTYNTDPLGSFKIETDDYVTIAQRIKHSSSLVNIPSLLLLEGGYVVENLGENLAAFLRGWEGTVDVLAKVAVVRGIET
jgi:acetoin utilization deacetylase AcuC-like enzyme